MSMDAYQVVPLTVERTKKQSVKRIKPKAIRLNTQWGTLLTGFFLARGLLLAELLPFGIGFLAANRKYLRKSKLWPLFGVLLGLFSIGSFFELYPYYVGTLGLWFFSTNKQGTRKHGYWVVWIVASFLLFKAPLTWITEHSLMVWIESIAETLIAIAAYSIIEPVVERSVKNKGAAKEVQFVLLLTGIFLGVDFLVFGIQFRILVMLYLILASARIGGLALASMVGPCLLVLSLLLGLPEKLAILFVTLALAAGLLSKIPGGLLFGGLFGYLLSIPMPITPENISLLFAIFFSGLLVYLTPKQCLQRLERVIPNTRHYLEIQENRNLRIQTILQHKIQQLAEVFLELSVSLQGVGYIGQQLSTFAKVVEQLGEVLSEPVDFAETIEETLWERLDCLELSELTVLKMQDGYEIVGKRNNLCGRSWCTKVARESDGLLQSHFQVQGRDCLTHGKCGFHIGLKASYRLDVKTAKVAQGSISGDNETVFQLSSNKLGLLISDGMGTGENAASDSLATISLLEKMIKLGFEREVAVKVINQTLLARNTTESFATVDLAVVDLQTGQIEFVKIGSAPSFIKSGNSVAVIQNSSLPIGILNHVQIEPERCQLNEGDYLVMVTDGIIEFQKDVVYKDNWLKKILENMDASLNSQDLANSILAQSLAASNGQVCDDMMVLVARLIKDDPEIYPYQRS